MKQPSWQQITDQRTKNKMTKAQTTYMRREQNDRDKKWVRVLHLGNLGGRDIVGT